MPIHNTVRNEEDATEKVTMTIDDDWQASLFWTDEILNNPQCSLLIETLEERFELVLYVTDKEKLKMLLDQFLQDLQELYIE